MKAVFIKYKKEIAAASIALTLSIIIQAVLNWYVSINSYQNDTSFFNMNIFSTVLSFIGLLIVTYSILNKKLFKTLIVKKKAIIAFMVFSGIILAYTPIYSYFGSTLNSANGSLVYIKNSIIDSLPSNKAKGYQQCTKDYKALLLHKTELKAKKQQQMKVENTIAADILKCYSSHTSLKNFDYFKEKNISISNNTLALDIGYVPQIENKTCLNSIKNKLGNAFIEEVLAEARTIHNNNVNKSYELYTSLINNIFNPVYDNPINKFNLFEAIDILGQKPTDDTKSLYSLTKNNKKLQRQLSDNFITYDRHQSMLQYEKDKLAEIQEKIAYYRSLNTINLIKTGLSNSLWLIALLSVFILSTIATATVLYSVVLNSFKYLKWCIEIIKHNK